MTEPSEQKNVSGEIKIWLKANGKYAVMSSFALGMAAVGIWGGQDRVMIVISMSAVACYFTMWSR